LKGDLLRTTKKKYSIAALSGIIVLSIVLGALSAWPLETSNDYLSLAAYALIIFTAQIIFFLVLPRFFKLPTQIFIAMIAGAAAGWIAQATQTTGFAVEYLNIFGTVFILLLKFVITPLIFVSILCGVAGIGDPRKLGSVGIKALIYYLGTTCIAVLIGMMCVNIIQPGARQMDLDVDTAVAGQSPNATQTDEPSIGMKIQKHALPMLIHNPIMDGQNPLAIIFFAIVLGISLAALGAMAEPALKVFRALDKAFISIIMGVMLIAPIGVFTLMTKAIAELGIEYIVSLAIYSMTVILGLGLHFCILSFVICPVLGRISPMHYLRGIAAALALSFSTSSSSATLPVTIDCTTRRIGADKNVTNFMLPIGATVNMDGTALYQAVAVLFIAQVLGKDLSLAQQLGVFISALMVSVGTAGIPGGSIGLMPLVLAQAGIGAEYVGIVIGVDRFLDMSRTVVNITGDSVGAIVVSRLEGFDITPETSREEPPDE